MFPVWFQPEFFERNVPNVPLRGLQIGTYTGDATQWLLNNRDVRYIDDVDTWEGSQEDAHYSLDFKSVEEYYDSRFKNNPKVIKHKMTSDNFFWNVPKALYNFILIDGDHTALQTAKDALNAFDRLEAGGVMAFDDYLWHTANPSVDINNAPVHGIEAALKIFGNRIEIIENSYQLWVKRC
jgi:Methyltransferase domain